MKKERPLIRYEKLSKEDLVDYCRVYWRRIHNDEVLFNEIYKDIESLKSDVSVYKSQMNAYKKKYLALLKANTELEEEKQKMKEDVDFFYKSAKQFREDGESWRKEAELLLGIKILGKTLSERIDDDKKVVRMDTSCMEEDTLQELRDLGEI